MSERRRGSWRLAPVLALLSTAAACGSESDAPRPQEVWFSGPPGDDVAELQERCEPVARYLTERLGVDFRYVAFSDLDQAVDAFQHDEVQLVWLSGIAGARAPIFVKGTEVLAQGALEPTRHSYFVAHEDTGLTLSKAFPEDLRGTNFTFGPKASTASHVMPEYFLSRFVGSSGEAFFGSPDHFAESDAAVAKLVESATFQTGVLDQRTYDRMVEEGMLDRRRCRVVWVTPDYPDAHWLAHPSLAAFGPDFIERLQEALLTIDDPELLEALGSPEGLVPAANADFKPLVEMAIELELMY